MIPLLLMKKVSLHRAASDEVEILDRKETTKTEESNEGRDIRSFLRGYFI